METDTFKTSDMKSVLTSVIMQEGLDFYFCFSKAAYSAALVHIHVVMCMEYVYSQFLLVTGFNGRFATAEDNTVQFTVTHTTCPQFTSLLDVSL
jgi:hypothetical protein